MSFETDTINGFIRRKTVDFEFSAILNPNNNMARIAGLLYLVMIVCGMAPQLIRSSLVVAGDAAVTVSNITASGTLFRAAFLGDLVMATVFILFAWALYVLLKPVNKNVALLFVLLATASAAILSLNMLNQFAVMVLLNDAGYLAAFGAEQMNAFVMLFMDLHYYGYYIAQITFGLWLLPLGYLAIRSGFLPKILGIMLIIATFGHLMGFFTAFLLPGYESFADIVALLEIPFGLYLIVKGTKSQEPATARSRRTAES